MKKVTLAVLPLAALLFAACGTDTKSCQTNTAALGAVPSACTLAAGTTVTVQVRAACQTCSDTRPTCGGEIRGSDIELTPIFYNCQEDAGCPATACNFATFDCVFTTPAASSTYRLAYPTSTGGNISYSNVTVAPNGSTTCRL